MYNFTFHRPTGLRQAGNMLGKLEEAKILAGGQTLIPTMKLRLASPNNIVDLNAIEGELSGIELKGRSIVIGAMTRHVDVANSAVVKENLPALAYLAGLVGDASRSFIVGIRVCPPARIFASSSLPSMLPAWRRPVGR